MEYTYDDVIALWKDKSGSSTLPVNINVDLINDQELNDEQVLKILELHQEREEAFKEAEEIDGDNIYVRERNLLHIIAKQVERIEFKLQSAWGFDTNSDFHSWWYRIPHCTCPTMDNDDRFGTGHRVINGDCPIHGSL